MSYCYNCKNWRIAVPNLGGLVDQGLCALYCDARFEDDTCGRWVEASEDDRAVITFCRKLINEHCSKHCADVRETAETRFKDNMRQRILKIFDLEENVDE